MSRITQATHLRPAATLPALVAHALAAVLLAVAFSAHPGAVQEAYAAPLEDCDADGFDDATGVPVPWPGYDETHGDTPAGPGTASWWIEQNQGSGGGDGSSGGSTNPGSGTDSGSGSGNPAPSSGTGGSGSGSKSPSRGGTTSGNGTGGTGAITSGAQDPGTQPTAGTQASTTSTTGAAQQAPSGETTRSVADSSAVLAATSGGSVGRGSQDDLGLWGALTAGFRGDNRDMPLGLGLLASLSVAGVIALGVSAVRDRGAAHARRTVIRG